MTCIIYQLDPLPCCSLSLKIGKFASAVSNCYAIFTNKTTKLQFIKQFSTDAQGVIVIDVADIIFPTDQPFEITFESVAGYAVLIPFIIDGITLNAAKVRFEKRVKADGSTFDIIQGIAKIES